MQSQSQDEISVLRILYIFLSQKFIMLSIPLLVVSVAIGITLKQQKWYESTAVWMPSSAGNSNSGLNNLASLAGISLGGQALNSEEFYSELLLADLIVDSLIIKKFNLQNGTKKTLLETLAFQTDSNNIIDSNTFVLYQRDAITNFLSTRCKLTKDKTIELSILAPDPILSYELNEFIIRQLLYVSDKIRTEKAETNRDFLALQHDKQLDSLHKSEMRLVSFNQLNSASISPNLMMNKERLMRDVQLNAGIVLELRKQLEMARLEVAQKRNMIVFIKRPQIALWAKYPMKKIIVAISLLVGIILACLIAMIRYWWKQSGKDTIKQIRLERSRW